MPRTHALTISIAALSAAALLAATGCSSDAGSGPDTADVDSGNGSIVATTTILGTVTADIVECADPEATVTTLMPVGADPHDFAPSSAQVAELVGADLVIANGLGLEAGLDDALESARTDGATVLEVADLVDPLPFGAHADDHADEADDDSADQGADDHADDHGSEDPHFWFDMQRMATAAELIGEQLAESRDGAYAECGAQVADEIRAAEADVRTTLEAVPADRRVLVTDHDALGYFSDAYGFEIAGTVIPGGSTLGEPSSADLAALVATIQAEDVPAIFTNSAEPSTLADAVSAETGRDIAIVPLYVGTLGEPGSDADTYVGFMTANATSIATALSP